jgi:2-amino-4-hydroxy-6-hydroxymethyldihydropteridine diphosphokinase
MSEDCSRFSIKKLDMDLQKLETAFLSIGSNKGSPLEQCATALLYLDQSPRVKVMAISSLYLTEPVATEEPGWFFNYALKIQTDMSPFELLDVCQEIETKLGRTRKTRGEARPIDVDMLYFGSQIIETERLTVPHPGVADRKFVLVPLTEIAPEVIDPVRNRSIYKLLKFTEDRHAILLYEKQWWPCFSEIERGE